MSCSAVSRGLLRQHEETNKGTITTWVFAWLRSGAVLIKLTVTFALANLFQVLESNIGIIGACLPVMRQPLRQYLPRLFGTSRNGKPSRSYYADDRFVDQYVLQNVSGGQKQGSQGTWHDVSISGPLHTQHHKSASRESDELRIIDGMAEVGHRDGDSGGELDEKSSKSHRSNAIRKDVVVSVDRT